MNPEDYLILIVDDEETMRISMADLLKLEGYQTATAKDGLDAIEKISNQTKNNPDRPFDLILLDLKMPGKDGLEVLRHTTRSSPDTQIILLTAHGSLQSAIEALQLGIHDYILKPALPEKIIESVRNGLQKRHDQIYRNQVVQQLEKSIHALKEYPAAQTTVKTDFGKSNEMDFTQTSTPKKSYTLSIKNDVIFIIDQRKIISKNIETNLTPSETRLLNILADNKGLVFNSRELVSKIHGYELDYREASNIIRPLVCRLRAKLSRFPDGENWIKCIRSSGYFFDPHIT